MENSQSKNGESIKLVSSLGGGRGVHCLLNECKTAFQTACEQSRFSGGFVSIRAIILASWLDSNFRNPDSGSNASLL